MVWERFKKRSWYNSLLTEEIPFFLLFLACLCSRWHMDLTSKVWVEAVLICLSTAALSRRRRRRKRTGWRRIEGAYYSVTNEHWTKHLYLERVGVEKEMRREWFLFFAQRKRPRWRRPFKYLWQIRESGKSHLINTELAHHKRPSLISPPSFMSFPYFPTPRMCQGKRYWGRICLPIIFISLAPIVNPI